MNRDCIFEDFYVSDLNFDLMNGVVRQIKRGLILQIKTDF